MNDADLRDLARRDPARASVEYLRKGALLVFDAPETLVRCCSCNQWPPGAALASWHQYAELDGGEVLNAENKGKVSTHCVRGSVTALRFLCKTGGRFAKPQDRGLDFHSDCMCTHRWAWHASFPTTKCEYGSCECTSYRDSDRPRGYWELKAMFAPTKHG